MDIDISGDWIFDGHPWDAPYAGQIKMNLKQSGTTIIGELVQLIDPFSGKPPADPEATKAYVDGEIVEDESADNHLVVLKRINQNDAFRAVFTGVINKERTSISGTFTNTLRKGGSFVMTKSQ